MHPEEESNVDTTQQRRSTAPSPAKPLPTKSSSHTPLSDPPSSAKAAQPKAEITQPEAEAKKSDKHYEYLAHSPVPADPIIGDVDKTNMLQGKLRTRQAPRSLKEAHLGKVAHAVKAEVGANAGKKKNAKTKANPPEKKPAKARGRAPKTDPALTEPNPDSDTEKVDGITATTIRGDIVKLVKQSLQVAGNVAEFMRDTNEAEEGEQMDIQVENLVNDRAKKRKAKAKAEGGSVAKRAKVRE
jgi:hypothetical protein